MSITRRSFLGLGLLAGMAMALVIAERHAAVERQVLIASRSTNQVWVVTADGTNALLRLNQKAIPILLSWSHGRDPIWFNWANEARRLLRMPPLPSTWFSKSEDARRAFLVLRGRASSAVPVLVQRL